MDVRLLSARLFFFHAHGIKGVHWPYLRPRQPRRRFFTPTETKAFTGPPLRPRQPRHPLAPLHAHDNKGIHCFPLHPHDNQGAAPSRPRQPFRPLLHALETPKRLFSRVAWEGVSCPLYIRSRSRPSCGTRWGRVWGSPWGAAVNIIIFSF